MATHKKKKKMLTRKFHEAQIAAQSTRHGKCLTPLVLSPLPLSLFLSLPLPSTSSPFLHSAGREGRTERRGRGGGRVDFDIGQLGGRQLPCVGELKREKKTEKEVERRVKKEDDERRGKAKKLKG